MKLNVNENIYIDYDSLSDFIKENLTEQQFLNIINKDNFKHNLDNLILDFYNNVEEILERNF